MTGPEKHFDSAFLRREMIERQIAGRGIDDERVLAAMAEIPRELFVPAAEIENSYQDRPLPIGWGQTISQPYIVAFMSALLELKGHEKVLEIGTGSGYQTAVLAALAGRVFSIELRPELAARARRLLQEELSLKNVCLRQGDGKPGWPEEAPFDRILVTAAAAAFPESLAAQLDENGLAVAPVGVMQQKLLVLRRRGSELQSEEKLYVSFVPLL